MSLAESQGIKNTQKLSEFLGYKSPEKLYRLERDANAKPSFAVLQDISKKFENVDMNFLIRGVETQNNIVNESGSQYEKQLIPKTVTVDNNGKDNIVLVPVTAQAGYLEGYGDQEFIRHLPSYRLPKIDNGTFRMFEVKGHSMYPTLHSGCIAVGEWVEDINNIKDNNIYIVITNDGMVIKRVFNRSEKYGTLYLKSDNRKEYPSYTINPNEILEIWKLKTALLFEFQDPADLYDRVNDLEVELMMLNNRLQ